MKLAVPILAACLTTTVLSAQRITLGGQAGPTGVQLNTVLNGNPHQSNVPPAAPIPNPWLLTDSQSWSGGGFGAEASTTRTTSTAGFPLAQCGIGASGGVIDPATSGSARSAADLLFSFTSARPHVGTVILRYHSTGSGSGSLAIGVDIGLDGIDFVGGANQLPIERSFPATIGAGALPVQVVGVATTALTGRGNSSYSAFLEIEFVPRASAVAYGTTCPFALEADTGSTPGTDTFAFQILHGPSLATAFLTLGAGQLAVPIPPSNCLLRVDPLVFVLVPLDSQGAGAVEFTVAHVPGLSFFAQALIPRLEVSGWTWQTSNGQQLTAR